MSECAAPFPMSPALQADCLCAEPCETVNFAGGALWKPKCHRMSGEASPRMRGGKEEPRGVQAEEGSTECEEEAAFVQCVYIRMCVCRGPGCDDLGYCEQRHIPAAVGVLRKRPR